MFSVMNKISVSLMALFATTFQVCTHASNVSAQPVQLKKHVAPLDKSNTQDFGYSFYIGSPFYKQGNDELFFVTINSLGGAGKSICLIL